MVSDFIKFFYLPLIVVKIKNSISDRKRRKEIQNKIISFLPISEEEFNICKQLNPVFKNYKDYMKIANLPPEEKEKMQQTSEVFIKIIKETIRNDSKMKNKKHFFSD